MGKRNWSEDDLDLLRKEYPRTDTESIATLLHKTKYSIRSKATDLGLKKETGYHGKSDWKNWDDNILRLLYPNQPLDLIVYVLDRSVCAIRKRAEVLKIKRSAEYMEKLKKEMGKSLEKSGEKSRFRAGDGKTGWNKGRKQSEYMSIESIEKTKATRFSKGNVPINYKSIGHERLTKDGYIEVKVRDAEDHKDNFELKHRVVYEKHHGPIPEGMIVEFIDGNRMNFSIQNLRLVSRLDNVLNNSLKDTCIAKKLLKTKDPAIVEKALREIPEVIELKRKSIILKRKLNDKQKY